MQVEERCTKEGYAGDPLCELMITQRVERDVAAMTVRYAPKSLSAPGSAESIHKSRQLLASLGPRLVRIFARPGKNMDCASF